MMQLEIIKRLKENNTINVLFFLIFIFACNEAKKNELTLELNEAGIDFTYNYTTMKTDKVNIYPHVINFKYKVLKNSFKETKNPCNIQKLELINKDNIIETNLINISNNEILATLTPNSYAKLFGKEKRTLDFDSLYFKLKSLKLNNGNKSNEKCQFKLQKSKSSSIIFTFPDNYVLIYIENPNSKTIEKQIIFNNELISSRSLTKITH